MLKGLSAGNDYDINDTQSDTIEELIHVEAEAIVLNVSVSKPEQQNQMLGNSTMKI